MVPNFLNKNGGVSSSDAVEANAMIAHMIGGDLPLPEAVRLAASGVESRRLKEQLLVFAEQLDRGCSVAEAAEHRDLSPQVARLMVSASESGDMVKMLQALVEQEFTEIDRRRRVIKVMIYPAVLLCGLLVVILLMKWLFVDSISETFYDFEVELPDATDMVRAFYRIFSLPVVAVIVGVLTVLYFLPKPMFFLRWLYAVPVIGPLRRYATLTRIFGQLGILLKMEVPLPEALRLVAGSLRCPAMRRSLEESARLAEHGHPVSEVLSMRWPFGATPHPFLKSAETFDDYPRAMEETHELMDQQAEHYYALWEAVLPPVALVMIAVLVVGTLFTLFLPMIKLVTELSG